MVVLKVKRMMTNKHNNSTEKGEKTLHRVDGFTKSYFRVHQQMWRADISFTLVSMLHLSLQSFRSDEESPHLTEVLSCDTIIVSTG